MANAYKPLTADQLKKLYDLEVAGAVDAGSVLQNQGMTLQNVADTGAFTPEELKIWSSKSKDPWLQAQSQQQIFAPDPMRPVGGGEPFMGQTQTPGAVAGPVTVAPPSPSPVDKSAPTPRPRTPAPTPWSVGTNPLLGKDNPFLGKAIQTAQDSISKQYLNTTRPQWDAMDRASGSFGNTAIAEGRANSMEDLSKTLGAVDTTMRMQDYNLQAGLGEQDLNRKMNDYQFGQNLDFGIDQSNFNRDLATKNFGLNLFDKMLGYTGFGMDLGDKAQQMPIDMWQKFMTSANNTGGLGGGNTQQYPGNPFMGAIGGWQLGQLFGK